MASGQTMFDVKQQAENGLKTLTSVVFGDSGESFTKNQLIKLERIYLKMNQDRKELLRKGSSKGDFSRASAAIEKNYAPMIESVLSSSQRLKLQNYKQKYTVDVVD